MGRLGCNLQRQDRVRRSKIAPLALVLAALAAIAALAAVVLCGKVALSAELLTIAPALAVALFMLAKPYAGERAIAKLRERCAGRIPRGAATASSLSRTRATIRIAVRGGRLIAAALAGRAPPARALVG
jgi:hypothetical protein